MNDSKGIIKHRAAKNTEISRPRLCALPGSVVLWFSPILGFLLMCLPLFTLAAPAPDDPEAERAAFKLRDGYEVNLFASEADGVLKPIQMRWDSQGRLWVACSTGYPKPNPDE